MDLQVAKAAEADTSLRLRPEVESRGFEPSIGFHGG